MKTKVLFYCTKGGENLTRVNYGKETYLTTRLGVECEKDLFNGKIVCECEVECEEMYTDENGMSYYTDTIKEDYMVSKLVCLDDSDIYNYLGNNIGYALHISNLKVFNKPKELEELEYLRKYKNCDCCPYGIDEEDMHLCGTCKELKPLVKAPQNMMWVWYKGQKYCLISIRPEWLCKILNGEKTIEVRKKILKGMM